LPHILRGSILEHAKKENPERDLKGSLGQPPLKLEKTNKLRVLYIVA